MKSIKLTTISFLITFFISIFSIQLVQKALSEEDVFPVVGFTVTWDYVIEPMNPQLAGFILDCSNPQGRTPRLLLMPLFEVIEPPWTWTGNIEFPTEAMNLCSLHAYDVNGTKLSSEVTNLNIENFNPPPRPCGFGSVEIN